MTDLTLAAVLAILRGAGVTQIIMHYDGQNDSGDWTEVAFRPHDYTALTPPTVTEIADRPKIEDFLRKQESLWGFVYDTNPGFEINEGGYGTLTINVVAVDGSTPEGHIEVTHTVRTTIEGHYGEGNLSALDWN